jgi:hypothetical protein
MKEGYLQKKGQRLKGWKRRFFVCDGRTLSYYISRKDKKPNAVIPLEGCTVQDGGISETWNSPRIYLTDGTSGVMYCLSAEEPDAVTEWLVVLRNAVAKLAAGDAAQGGRSGKGEKNSLKTSYDEDEARYKRNTPLKSSASMCGEGRRASRLASGPNQTKHQNKIQHLSTNISLENELSNGMKILECLLTNQCSPKTAVIFRTIGVENGVIKSVGENKTNGKFYARGSVVLPVSSDVAAHLLCDHIKRSEWDIHFPISTHVATFGDNTDLVHLTGGAKPSSPVHAPFSTLQVPIAISATLGALLSSSWESVGLNAASAGILGGLLGSMDWSSFCVPRDLLVVRHVRATSSLKRSASCSDILDAEAEETIGHSVFLILEKSVVNELKPALSGMLRAQVGLSGWLVEPADLGRTLVTYVTDIDLRGWISRQRKKQFAIERLNTLAVLVEVANQCKLYELDLHDEEEEESVDENVQQLDEDFVDAQLAPGSSEFHPSSYIRGMIHLPTGGLKLIDKEIAKKQGGVLKDVLKSAGAKILEGKSAVSLSLPVRIFEPRSMLERFVDLFLYAPTFLNAAADATDPVERMKYVMTFAVAGLHHGVGQMKPFNPILGETYQAVLNDGTEVCCEHTSHHPPISNFQLLGKKYLIAGYMVIGASFSMKSNALIQIYKGPVRVSFEDGTVISYNLPFLQSGGLMWGDRTVDLVGSVVFEDSKNNLTCELKFNPDEKKGMGGMFATPKTPSDHIRGTIVNSATSTEICEAIGSWLEELRFEEKVYWTMDQQKSGYIVRTPELRILPSDSRNREDLNFLRMNDLDEAQEWKVKLEILQRADRKIRNEGRRPNHWANKDDSH